MTRLGLDLPSNIKPWPIAWHLAALIETSGAAVVGFIFSAWRLEQNVQQIAAQRMLAELEKRGDEQAEERALL